LRSRDFLAPLRHQLDCFAQRIVFRLDIPHAHRYGLVGCKHHADFDRSAGIGDIGSSAVPAGDIVTYMPSRVLQGLRLGRAVSVSIEVFPVRDGFYRHGSRDLPMPKKP